MSDSHSTSDPIDKTENKKLPIALDFDDKNECRRTTRNATPADRKQFINFMFDNFDSISGKNKLDLAKNLSKAYKDTYDVTINYSWVHALLRGGIVKLEDGTVTFKRYHEHTIDELCEHPSITKTIKLE